MEVLAAEIVPPRVDVRIEMHERDGAVLTGYGPQNRERNRMVATHNDRHCVGLHDASNPRFDGLICLFDAASRWNVDVASIHDEQFLERRRLLKVGVRTD